MNELTSNLRIEDVPKQEARPFDALGVIGAVETKEVSNGYTQVVVPLSYRLSANDATDRTFYARFNIKPHWLTAEFTQQVVTSPTTIDPKELIQYNINIKGLLRGLFTGAGIEEGAMDFRSLTGRLVGFRTKTQKNNPDRLEVARFFRPKVN